MYLIINRGNEPPKQLRFSTGPIYIGRQLGSQVFLPDKAVSRQHAVIYSTKDGRWVLEDLDSANKTYLNGKAIHKAEIKDEDTFKISNFDIKIHLRDSSSAPKPINMDDTIITTAQDFRTITRTLSDPKTIDIKIPARRITDLANATCLICKCASCEELLPRVIDILRKQFMAYHTWFALKDSYEGQLAMSQGKSSSGQSINIEDIPLRNQIARCLDRKEFELIPRVRLEDQGHDIRSAMIAPLVFDDKALGVAYVDNSLHQQQFETEELNYLMLISINIAAISNKLIS